MKTVLVAGATGYLGRFLLKELKRTGFITVALARDINKLKNMNSYVDRFVVAEATKTAFGSQYLRRSRLCYFNYRNNKTKRRLNVHGCRLSGQLHIC